MMQEWLKKLSARQIDLAGAGVCVATGLLFCVVGVLPLLRRSDYFARQQTRLEGQRRQAAQLARDVAVLKSRLAGIRKELADNPVQLQTAYHLNRRIAELADLAGQAGLVINRVQPGEPTSSPRFETVPIRLAGNGSYPVCAEFLRRLGRRFPDTAVDSFQVVGNPRKPGEPATFDVSLLWYAAARPRPEKS